MGTILSPDGTCKTVSPKNGHHFQLEEMQAIVEGYIEIIPTNDGRIMILNEEGKLLDLPRNDQATALANLPSPDDIHAMLAAYGDTIIFVGDLDTADSIAGTVLVCGDDEMQ